MPSFRAYLISWVIWIVYYRRKHSSELQLLQGVNAKWKAQIAKEEIPTKILSAVDMRVTETTQDDEQHWKVYRCLPLDSRGERVVIYWHGGAFINGTSPQHWTAVHRIVSESRIPVVFPQYKLAPLSTADEWCQAALNLVINIADDPTYAAREIVLMGDSAGGWMVLRLMEMLCGIVLGEEMKKLSPEIKGKVANALRRMSTGIMISPLVDLEITDALVEKDHVDPWLSVELVKACRKLWIYGPREASEVKFDLDDTSMGQGGYDPSGGKRPYSDKRYSPVNGVEVFARYRHAYPDTRPFHLFTMIGTHDICHVGVTAMQNCLIQLGKDCVNAEIYEEIGLNHVYPLLPMPESEKAWKKIREVLE